MVRPDFFEILEAGRQMGLRMAAATCGWYLNETAARRLKEAELVSLSFSLDGADAQTHDAFRDSPGAFQTTLQAVQIAQQAGLDFQINTTITKQNLPQIDRIAQLTQTLGAFCWNPFILVPVGRADQIRDWLLEPEEYERLLERLVVLKERLPLEIRVTCGPQFARVCRQQGMPKAEKVSGCLAGGDFVFISCRGDVQPCGFLEISAGNLLEKDFATIWMEAEVFRRLRNLDGYKGVCGGCAYLRVCRGCRARAEAFYGDYLQQDPVCRLTRRSGEVLR